MDKSDDREELLINERTVTNNISTISKKISTPPRPTENKINIEGLNTPNNALSFLKRKRKDYEERDKEREKDHFLNNNLEAAGKMCKEEKRSYLDEKITDFFKYKKNRKSGNPLKSGMSDDESSCNSNAQNLKYISEATGNTLNNLRGNTPTKGSPKKKKLTKRLEKDIKEYFREFKLSSKTLNTLKKGNFLNSQPELILPVSKPKITLDISRLPVTSCIRNEKNHKEIDAILKSLSMRDKYEGLLNRELILPPNYKLLLLQFEFLDQGITELKFEKKSNVIVNFDTLDYYANEKQFKIGLVQEDFQKMLHVAPATYLYKYESKKNGSNFTNRHDVILDIPNDFQQRLKVFLIYKFILLLSLE